MRLNQRLIFALQTVCVWSLCCSVVSAEESPLADAVERGDADAIRVLLDQHLDVNARQPDGMTALHWAVYLGQVSTAQNVLKAGAEVGRENRYGVTPLSIACRSGNEELVELLLSSGADSNGSLRGGETVLMIAARTGRLEAVNRLLAAGAVVNAKDRNQQTALMWAAADGHVDVVDLLLRSGAELRTPLPSGYTPLMFAVRQGHIDVVGRILAAGADVNGAMKPSKRSAKGPGKGTAPLLLAIENGHFGLALELLRRGADPNDQRTGFTPLHSLSWIRKPPRGDNEAGNPAPMGSGKLTSLQLVKELVAHGADVNSQKKSGAGGRGRFGKKGTTPFLCAAGTADTAYMRLLLELGADPTIPNDRNWTPLMMAAGIGSGSSGDEAGTEAECLEAVHYLLKLGAEINAVDREGETAMHGAAYKSLPAVVRLLVEKGAEISIWNKPSGAGRTPLSIACGYRPGNFKPSFATVAAIEKAMRAAGVTPPPPPKRTGGEYVE